jgi:hypothetical protein
MPKDSSTSIPENPGRIVKNKEKKISYERKTKMNILFWVLIVWILVYITCNIIGFGWTEEIKLSQNNNLKKLANVVNLIFLSLLLIYLFNLP